MLSPLPRTSSVTKYTHTVFPLLLNLLGLWRSLVIPSLPPDRSCGVFLWLLTGWFSLSLVVNSSCFQACIMWVNLVWNLLSLNHRLMYFTNIGKFFLKEEVIWTTSDGLRGCRTVLVGLRRPYVVPGTHVFNMWYKHTDHTISVYLNMIVCY